MDVEVPYYQEGEPDVRKKNIWRDRRNMVVCRVCRVGVNNPEGVKVGAEKWFV